MKLMPASRITTLGLVLLSIGVFGLGFLFYLAPPADSYVSHYQWFDPLDPSHFLDCILCQSQSRLQEEIQVQLPSRLPIGHSTSIEVIYIYTNQIITQTDQYRHTAIELLSPNFDVVPTGIISKTTINGVSTKWIWVVSPKELGPQSLLLEVTGLPRQLLDNIQDRQRTYIEEADVIKISDMMNNRSNQYPIEYKIEVVDAFGIPTEWGKWLSILISFAGSALTFPWLYSVLEKKGERKYKEEIALLEKTHQQQIEELKAEIQQLKTKRRK